MTLPKSVFIVSGEAFWGCENLKSVTILGDVKEIKDGTFTGCYNLETLTLPASITTISPGSLWHSKNLKDIYYGGTEEQWKKIEVNDPIAKSILDAATIHYNSKG